MQTDSTEICLSTVSLVQRICNKGRLYLLKGGHRFQIQKSGCMTENKRSSGVRISLCFCFDFVMYMFVACRHGAVWRSEDTLLQLAVSFCHGGPGNWTQVIGLGGGKHLRPLRNLAWSYLFFPKNPLKKIFSYSFNNWNFSLIHDYRTLYLQYSIFVWYNV